MNTKLLILDIDETLVFSTTRRLNRPEDFRVEEYFVYKRPHLDAFLSFAQTNFDVAIWTSSGSKYAQNIVEKLFTNPEILKFYWSRDRCATKLDPESREHYWIKDLKKVKRLGFDLKDVLVVDDSPEKLARNYGNHIAVSPFEGDLKDNELHFLQSYLRKLKNVDSVRSIEKRHWKSSFSVSGGLTGR